MLESHLDTAQPDRDSLQPRRRERMMVFAAGLGLLAPVAFILGAEPFEVPGQNSLKEILAGSLAVALYFAACQFWLARGSVRAHRISWPVLKAMIASLLAVCLLPILLEGGQSWLFASLPMLVSGCVGGVGGALLAPRKTITVTPEPHPTVNLAFCRRSLLTSAVLLVAVALVIVAAVIPPVADTFPGATRAVPAFWIIVFFHVLAAAALGSTAVRTTTVAGPERPPFLGLLVLLLVLSACALAGPGGAYFQEGPAMRTASVLLFICAGSDLIAALLFITAVSRFPERT